jgi:hypothetical protein
MRNKIRVGDDRMSVADVSIAEARGWSNFMLAKKFRGPGDTIERAAHEAEQTWGAPASIMLRLRHRRDIADMLLSNWLALRNAYEAACQEAERAAKHQEHLAREAGLDAANSRMVALASVLERAENIEAAK